MSLHELGEFGLINRLATRFAISPPFGVEGIGDDCAVIPYRDHLSYLVTTDLLAEEIHFLKSKISPEDLGYKTLAVNLSDIAAMGGYPKYVFLSMALSKEMELNWLDRFFDGFHQLVREEHLFVLGGDTSASPSPFFVNLTVIGECPTQQIKRRSAAKPGDLICCTDYLGDSGAGLQVLLNNLPLTPFTCPLVEQHQRPRPHLKEGQWLATQTGVHAMMDVSDGIDSDLQRMMEQSHCGAKINLEQIPLSPCLIKTAQEFGWNTLELAVTAGEDYCLLVTIDPSHYEQIASDFSKHFQLPLYCIGQITKEPGMVYDFHGHTRSFARHGFDHFTK